MGEKEATQKGASFSQRELCPCPDGQRSWLCHCYLACLHSYPWHGRYIVLPMYCSHPLYPISSFFLFPFFR